MQALWGISLNLTSVALLCMGVGFSVDFSVHIAKATSAQSVALSRADAVKKALSEQGVAVLHAGQSTLIAVVVLGFASSEAYRILFRILFGVVVYGVLHGMCFLPTLLLYLP